MRTRSLRWFDLTHDRIGRRDFLRIGRDVVACIALAATPAGSASRIPRSRAYPFPLGVASGDPRAGSVVLWTMVDPAALALARGGRAVAVTWEMADDPEFARVLLSGSGAAVPELANSVHVEVNGLAPGREYWYRFAVGGEVSPVGRTVTAPLPLLRNTSFRFAFASCQHYEQGFYTAYRHMAEENPELIVHLGDYIYERSYDALNVRRHGAGEARTLDGYRARYALYKSDAELQRAHAAAPWVVTFDDHEVANNYAGDTPAGSGNRANFLLRRAAAYQAYYEYLPLRASSLPSGPGMQIFRKVQFGSLIALHVLDTRQFRSDQACGDGVQPRCAAVHSESRSMLGADQERWLLHNLDTAESRWNVLANQVMFAQVERGAVAAPTYPMDQWSGYLRSRQRILDLMATGRVSNPVVITGDSHSNWVSDLKADFDRENSATVGAEILGTSISSGGDGNASTGPGVRARNPHLKHFSNRRGYVMNEVTDKRWEVYLRTVEYVSRPGAPRETAGHFVVENGRPGVEPA